MQIVPNNYLSNGLKGCLLVPICLLFNHPLVLSSFKARVPKFCWLPSGVDIGRLERVIKDASYILCLGMSEKSLETRANKEQGTQPRDP